jgi:sec-independent protein translocase protein TatA
MTIEPRPKPFYSVHLRSNIEEMTAHLIFLAFGLPEWVLIALVVVLLFGGRKIPELMKGLGQGIREFNNAKSDVKKHIEDGIKEEPKSENNTTK